MCITIWLISLGKSIVSFVCLHDWEGLILVLCSHCPILYQYLFSIYLSAISGFAHMTIRTLQSTGACWHPKLVLHDRLAFVHWLLRESQERVLICLHDRCANGFTQPRCDIPMFRYAETHTSSVRFKTDELEKGASLWLYSTHAHIETRFPLYRPLYACRNCMCSWRTFRIILAGCI